MDSGIKADLQEFMNDKVTFSISELKERLKKRGHRNLKFSGIKTKKGYLLTVEKGDLFFDLIIEGQEMFRIKDIQKIF